MSLRSFVKDILKMIKDYKWIIFGVALLTTIASLVLLVFLNTQEKPVEDDSANEATEYLKVGAIDIYADDEYENFQLEPQLPQEIIDEMHSWSNFYANFTLNTSDPAEIATGPVLNLDEEVYNPIEDFLRLNPSQYNNVKFDSETGKSYATFEINPDNGDVKLVSVQEGFNDYRIQLDIESREELLSSAIPDDMENLLLFKLGMNPGKAEFGYIESVYNWDSGLSYPNLFGKKKNFYVVDPTPFEPVISLSKNDGFSYKSLIIPGVISAIIGAALGVFVVFFGVLFNDKILYGFTYGWSPSDLFLEYNQDDSVKQITFDILQTAHQKVAIISQHPIPEELRQELLGNNQKDVNIYSEISEINLNDNAEEFTLVIQRNQTTKDWYHRQQKHLKTYRQKSVKLVDI